jgi:uncharacterized protein (DUF1015 family)
VTGHLAPRTIARATLGPVPRFEPFTGIRYATDDGRLDDVVAPPYDVIDAEERARLAARSEHNAVKVELPQDEGERDRYTVARDLFRSWLASGVLVQDEELSFYVYRMGFHDETGRPRQTAGVLGALELSAPGEGDILPHERTTPKDKADRLDILRTTEANLSPIWGLSSAEGLAALCEQPGPPLARATDEEGVHHRLWRITQPGVIEAISSAVASAPVIVADGHHRFEVGNAYREQRGRGGPWDLILAYVVELADEQLSVRAIHRLLDEMPEGFDLLEALSAHFEPFDAGKADESILARMDDAGALGLVTADGAWLLRPRPETVAAAEHDLDSARLDVAVAGLPVGTRVRYQHGVEHVVRAVERGQAQAGVLLRPATVAQIAAIGHGGDRMPPKTTFFHPKPRTGMVFRSVWEQ